MEAIQHFLSASILAGLTVFAGLLALALATYSALPPGAVKEWLDENLVHKLRGRGLKLETFKENSLILTLAAVLIYPVGDATLHILNDIFEDAFVSTEFEKYGEECRRLDSEGARPVSLGPARLCAPPGEPWDAVSTASWSRYYSLSEGGDKLKFTRIGEIEAREDQVDRETIDREKSYLQVLQIALLLLASLSLALVIYASRLLAPRVVFLTLTTAGLCAVLYLVFYKQPERFDELPKAMIAAVALLDLCLSAQAGWALMRWHHSRRRRAGAMINPPHVRPFEWPPPVPLGSPPARLCRRLWERAGGQLRVQAVWRSLLACSLLLVLLSGMFLTFEEYEEQEDKYERLVFHVWKNHGEEKAGDKKNKESGASAEAAPGPR